MNRVGLFLGIRDRADSTSPSRGALLVFNVNNLESMAEGQSSSSATDREASSTSPAGQRHFFTGPLIKTELLVEWLDQHGIKASTSWVDTTLPDDGDLGREVCVTVPSDDYDRAYQLFFAEREDEL